MGGYETLFSTLADAPLPEGLRLRIRERLRRAETARARFRAALYGAGAFASLGGLIYAGLDLARNVRESGFSEYASLLFSGDGAVYIAWKELAYSLAESLPIMGAIILLATLAALVWSSAHAYQSARRLAFA